MFSPPPGLQATLLEQVATRVRASTHNRIRNLSVAEEQGRVIVGGRVPSHHTRQLALQAALELLATDRFQLNLIVG